MAKFTFKTSKGSGKFASFFTPSHHIKLKKIDVGSIEHEAPHRIKLQVKKKDIMEDGNKNCPWKWITLKREFTSVDETKKYLQENTDKILIQFDVWLGK